MDFIDHLIFTANTDGIRDYPRLRSDYADSKKAGSGIPFTNAGIGDPAVDLSPFEPGDSLPLLTRENFIFYEDNLIIDQAIQKHWFDLNNGPAGIVDGAPALGRADFLLSSAPPYHMIYAYLIENSRISQIIEKLIYLFQHDETLGVASSGDQSHQKAFQWIVNTENLFFKTLSNNSFRNISGSLRTNPEATRRNAYYRMFGMDLAFGDINGVVAPESQYYKSKTANKEFIILFEQFLSEIWQAYTNAQNTSGANTTDYQRITDMSSKLREMLLARRGAAKAISLENYRFMNMSREEFSSVGFMSWCFFVISYNSPLVTFLGCQANNASERLANIGKKVGIEAHKKSQSLFDMAAPAATILRSIEYGTFEINIPSQWIRGTIESQTPLGSGRATDQQKLALQDLLAIINNWEKATGHNIKNTQSNNIRGTVTVQQNRTNGRALPVSSN